jgi:outer membrane protein assembly factor BamB
MASIGALFVSVPDTDEMRRGMRCWSAKRCGIFSAGLFALSVCLNATVLTSASQAAERGAANNSAAANGAAANNTAPRFLAGRLVAATERVHPPERWTATENIAWKTEVPGLGWSSPVVWGQHVFLTTCVSSGKSAPPPKGVYFGGTTALGAPPDKSEHAWKVSCIDLTSGSVVWEQVAHKGIPAKPRNSNNTLASETPTTDGERLYVLFGNLGLYCYDLNGKLLWTHPINARETRYGWGTAMSPVVFGERVYFADDNEEKSSLIALDKRTGKLVWTVSRDEKTNYSTPFVWENSARTELVVSGNDRVTSYDLDGKELWKIQGKSLLAISTPLAHAGLLYATSGDFVFGSNRLYAIRPGGSGDISLPYGKLASPAIAWFQKTEPCRATPLIVGENLYLLFDKGFLVCYDAATGKPIYEKNRLPNGNAFTSSPWSYADKIFCLNEDGVTFVIQAGREFKVLSTNPLAEDDMCRATPVIVGDKLVIRTAKRLYCVGAPGAKTVKR